MAASARDDDFDEYDKPGAERSRRRRGEDDDLDSDLEGDLLADDWLTAKKNPSDDASDEELNDDLLQSDDEDQNMSGQGVSLNATQDMGTSFGQQEPLDADYAEDIVNLAPEGYDEGDVEEEGYQQEGEEYVDEYSQSNDMEIPDGQMEYSGEQAEGDEAYQDEVLDIQINEPLDDEFQVDDYSTSYGDQQLEEQVDQHEASEEGAQEEEVEEETPGSSQFPDTDELENEPEPDEEMKEESDEEEDEDEESGRLRFKTERKDVTVVRLADAASKRRNIPETLELSEEAKADLFEFEEKERQRKQGRFGGRGRGGGGGGGGGRGRGRGGFPGFGMGDFRGDGGRGRMNDQRLQMMPVHMSMQQPPSRMPPPHHHHHLHHQQQQQHHHLPGPRGAPFQEHGGPLAQQPLQPLIPPHMAHRSPSTHEAPLRPQMEPPPRMMSPPPPNHQQPQSKNIHINPHFRGPTSSPVQVPLMPPAQSQPRPAVGPQRFPGLGDFQQHMPSNFGQPQRPPHHMEPWRGQPPPPPQDREPFFIGEPRFPGQHMFDHQSPGPLMNNNHQQLPGQGHMAFGQPGPGFNQAGQGQLGLFQREPPGPRPSLPPQGHQGMGVLTQHGGPPNRQPFMGHRQPFPQQGPPFPPQQIQFGMQGLMHSPMHSQLQHHDSPLSHQPMHQQQQQHHRQDLSQPPPHHHPHPQHQHHPNEQRPMMLHTQPPFHQQLHGNPRQMPPRPQNPQQRNAPIRPRMSPPTSKQQMQILPQRNSNLRELPVAPGNTHMNNIRPTSAPISNVRPVARATQGVRPGQNARPIPGGRGRAQPVAKAASLPGAPERTVVRRETPGSQPSTTPQDPDEDEETRQYRLKIEEQKRLREEILKRKEMRRQMQAGVRKKELLERITGQGTNQDPPQQPQQPPPPPPPLQQQRQQAVFPLKPQQQQQNPQQGIVFPPNGTPQTPPLRQNVKTRLQMAKGGQQQQLNTVPGPNQQAQWQQQRRNVTQQNPIRPGPQFQSLQAPPGNMPMHAASVVGQGPGPGPVQGLKPGVKRTVMQRANSGGQESPQVPQKVRVVKLLGGGDATDANALMQQQQQTTRPPNLRQGPIRKVTMANPMGQQIQGLGMPQAAPQGGRGGMGNPQQNRVVVPCRGRARGGTMAGGGQMGRGRLMPTRQSQRAVDSQPCTVSIEGLSTSTTDMQLRNLLGSIGPIQMFEMLPQQRKAIAKFACPQHAQSFQVSFHRHMIDLSHIDVSLIDG